jgi:hypothetical protein
MVGYVAQSPSAVLHKDGTKRRNNNMNEGAPMKKPNKLTGVVRSSRIPSRVRDLWIHLLQMIKKQNKPKMWARKTKRTQMESHKDEITKHRELKGSDTFIAISRLIFPFNLISNTLYNLH